MIIFFRKRDFERDGHWVFQAKKSLKSLLTGKKQKRYFRLHTYNVPSQVTSNFTGSKYAFWIYMDLKRVEKNPDWFLSNAVTNG